MAGTTTITKGGTTITPTQVLGYEADNEAANVFHTVIGRANLDVSLNDDGLRKGTLALLFLTRADAWAARALHVVAGTFTLVDSVQTQLNMTYVRDGTMKIALDMDSSSMWLLSVGYQEVSA